MGSNGDDTSMSTWQRLRKAAAEVLESESVETAIGRTKGLATEGGHAAASMLSGAKKAVTQEEAWEQLEESLSALTDVARVHHAMILDLVDRVSNLEKNASASKDEDRR